MKKIKKIQARFVPFEQLKLSSLLGAVGVYLFWAGNAKVRPTYLGEGIVLERLARHWRKYGPSLIGWVAVIKGGTYERNKWDGEVVERVLMSAALDIDQRPRFTDMKRGRSYGFAKLWNEGHRRVEISISGTHPLRFRSPLARTHRLVVDLTAKGRSGVRFTVKHPWRRVGVRY